MSSVHRDLFSLRPSALEDSLRIEGRRCRASSDPLLRGSVSSARGARLARGVSRADLRRRRTREGLAQLTADLAIKWGRPNRWLHERYAIYFVAQWRGMWSTPSTICSSRCSRACLATRSKTTWPSSGSRQSCSQGGESLGRLLRQGDAEDAHVAVATSFWDAAVDVGERAPPSLGSAGWPRRRRSTMKSGNA